MKNKKCHVSYAYSIKGADVLDLDYFHGSYKGAVDEAQHAMSEYRPGYIIKRTEIFEVCALIDKKGNEIKIKKESEK